MFEIGREQYRNRESNMLFRSYFAILGEPEIGAKIRCRLAIREIKKYPLERLSDVGCGKGHISFWVARRYRRATVVGIDNDETKIQSNKKLGKLFHLSNLHYKSHDLIHFTAETKYDVIVATDVLEHI